MHLSPAHVGLHRAVRERGYPPSRTRSLDPNTLQQCASYISNSEQIVDQWPIPSTVLCVLHTVHSSPDRGHKLRCDPGPVGLAALTRPYLVRSSFIFLQPAHRRFIKS